MTITRIGATKTYAQHWGLAFGQKSEAKADKSARKPNRAASKKAANKPAKGKGK